MSELPIIVKKIRSSSYSRTKGHGAERCYVNKFKSMGFPFCKTSRQASRLLDDSGIDISGIPFNVQIKSGYEKARPKADVLFKDMKELLLQNFPPHDPVHGYPKILIHKLDSRTPERELVTMTWKDFLPFLEAYKQVKGL